MLKSSQLSDIPCFMKQSGESHESKKQFYVRLGSDASEAGRVSLDLCAGRSSAAATQGSAGLESNPRSDGQTLASSRQKRGWRAGARVACWVVCAIGSLNLCQGLSLAAERRVCGGERSSAALLRTEPAERAAHSRSREHCAGDTGFGRGGCGGGQSVGSGQSERVGLYQRRDSLFGHNGAGAEDRLSTRARNPQRFGRTLRACTEKTQAAWGEAGARGDRDYQGDLSEGQASSPVCQDDRRTARDSQPDRRADREVDGAKRTNHQASWRARQRSQTERPSQAQRDERSGKPVVATDQVLDGERQGGSQQDPACGFERGAGDGLQQGRTQSALRFQMADPSFQRGLYGGAASQAPGERIRDADREFKRLSRDVRCKSQTEDSDLRSRRALDQDCRETKKSWGQENRAPPARTRSMAGGRERSKDSQKRTGENRRQHWTIEEQKVRIQWSARAQRGDANSGWPNGDLVGKFEYADARPCRSRESSWRIVLLRSKLRGEPNKFNLAEVIRPGYGQGIHATRSNLPPANFRGRTEPQINTFITINFSCF